MQFVGKTGEFLTVMQMTNDDERGITHQKRANELMLLWALDDDSTFTIDGVPVTLNNGQIICLTEFHNVLANNIGRIRVIKFNRPFFCIVDNDSEIGCKGILFFGAATLPIINIPAAEIPKFDLLWNVFLSEMETSDNLQMEMLQMLLKRLLIICTRLFKEQHTSLPNEHEMQNVVREFNFLVEQHFKALHSVSDYAAILHKSPKTLSNVFLKCGHRSPLTIIQDRIMLEARRLLYYTDKPIKEIAFATGFDDIQAFSRFFKSHEGISPSTYKEKSMSGINANHSGKQA